jgi:hypothetical protein
MLKKILGYPRLVSGIVCSIVLFAFGLWVLMPQTKLFACWDCPCMTGVYPCAGINTSPGDCPNRTPYCGGSCGISCAAGPVDTFCGQNDLTGHCYITMVNCTEMLKYKCQAGFEECKCVGEAADWCTRQVCNGCN